MHDQTAASRESALRRCAEQVKWYTDAASRHRVYYTVAQLGAFFATALTSVLILWTELPKTVQALPAAIATLLIGLNGVFRWRESWARFATTAEALKSERIKFETYAVDEYPSGNPDAAIRNFVVRIEQIAAEETAAWRRQADSQARSRTGD